MLSILAKIKQKEDIYGKTMRLVIKSMLKIMVQVANMIEISLTVLAAGTAKSLWPTKAKQMFLTGFLSANFFCNCIKLRACCCITLLHLTSYLD